MKQLKFMVLGITNVINNKCSSNKNKIVFNYKQFNFIQNGKRQY